MHRTALPFVLGLLLTACANSAVDEPAPPVDTTLSPQASDAGSEGGSTKSDSGNVTTQFPPQSNPEGKVPTNNDTTGGCTMSGTDAPTGTGLIVLFAAAAIVSARRRRCT